MTKRKIEVEVEYPDCDICGRCIESDEQYLVLDVRGVIWTQEREGETTSALVGNPSINVCNVCIGSKKVEITRIAQQYIDKIVVSANQRMSS